LLPTGETEVTAATTAADTTRNIVAVDTITITGAAMATAAATDTVEEAESI
jgi:hypothetical protein